MVITQSENHLDNTLKGEIHSTGLVAVHKDVACCAVNSYNMGEATHIILLHTIYRAITKTVVFTGMQNNTCI